MSEVKLLGTIITIITNDIKWERKTDYLTKKAWKRMQLLYNADKFTKKTNDLKTIFKTFI